MEKHLHLVWSSALSLSICPAGQQYVSSAAVVNLVEHGVSYPQTAARAEDQQMDAVGVWTDVFPPNQMVVQMQEGVFTLSISPHMLKIMPSRFI